MALIPTQIERLAASIAEAVRDMARGSAQDPGGWSFHMALFPGTLSSEDVERVRVIGHPAPPAEIRELGELVRLNFNETGLVATARDLRHALILLVSPFIEGAGQTIAKETPEGIVVLAANVSEIQREHWNKFHSKEPREAA
jgi:hypothetical protein